MSKSQRDKGARVEREIVQRHLDMGVKAERVPMSGASAYTHDGDVDIYPFGEDAGALVCEVKARANGGGFTTLEKWLGESDVMFLRRDRQDPMVVLPWRVWERICKKL